DVAPRTFFSYFQTKEDVVLDEGPQRFDQLQQTLQQRPPGETLLAAFRRVALEGAAALQAQSAQQQALARIVRATPAIQARIRDRMGQWEEQLAAMIAQERQAPPDDLDAHVVAAPPRAAPPGPPTPPRRSRRARGGRRAGRRAALGAAGGGHRRDAAGPPRAHGPRLRPARVRPGRVRAASPTPA